MERAALIDLLRATGSAEECGGFFFLCDPRWGAAERAQLTALRTKIEKQKTEIADGWLCVPTGGTSGGVRFARHDERTLTAAARGFCAHFGMDRVNAVDVLPAFHVSGLMARVRCAETGGKHVACDWKQIEAGKRPVLRRDAGGGVISLVPTQLQRLLGSAAAVEWLRAFQVIFIGGGPAWPALTDAAAAARLPLSLSYGMTETAAMVTALRPEEFLAGTRGAGCALPHARISLSDDDVVVIEGESVFRGYFPERRETRRFVTEDLARIDEQGGLHVLGRCDATIITGGKKVQPAEVEEALRATGQFEDVAVIGVADPEWGEAVVACYPAEGSAPDLRIVEQTIGSTLAPFKRPKRYVAVAVWPRNARGKINRGELVQAAGNSVE